MVWCAAVLGSQRFGNDWTTITALAKLHLQQPINTLMTRWGSIIPLGARQILICVYLIDQQKFFNMVCGKEGRNICQDKTGYWHWKDSKYHCSKDHVLLLYFRWKASHMAANSTPLKWYFLYSKGVNSFKLLTLMGPRKDQGKFEEWSKVAILRPWWHGWGKWIGHQSNLEKAHSHL